MAHLELTFASITGNTRTMRIPHVVNNPPKTLIKNAMRDIINEGGGKGFFLDSNGTPLNTSRRAILVTSTTKTFNVH